MNKYVILLSALTLLSCDPFGDLYDNIDDVIYYEANSHTTNNGDHSSEKVITWNMKFAGGRIDFWFDCYGDRVLMTHSEVLDNLQGLTEFINEQQPVFLILQEIDINSKRTAYIDQVQFLLDHTDLNYGVYASQWQNQFVPSDGLGPIDSGNAILSIYPLDAAERIALPLRSDQDALTRHFYLKRNILKTRVNTGVMSLWILNIHTSAYSKDGTKKKQIDRLVEELNGIHQMNELFIAGGDFNEIPPGSAQTSNFDDSICQEAEFQADDYSGETDWLDELYSAYYPAVDLNEYLENEEAFFTHTTNGNGIWTRKLDYLFTNVPDGFANSQTHQNTMMLSDHAPLSAGLPSVWFWDIQSNQCSDPGAAIEYSCVNQGCPDGFSCDFTNCYPSYCECSESGLIICTEDCAGSVCLPDI